MPTETKAFLQSVAQCLLEDCACHGAHKHMGLIQVEHLTVNLNTMNRPQNGGNGAPHAFRPLPLMRPDQTDAARAGAGLFIDDGAISVNAGEGLSIHTDNSLNVNLATDGEPGIVRPDGRTLAVDANGVLSACAILTLSAALDGAGRAAEGRGASEWALARTYALAKSAEARAKAAQAAAEAAQARIFAYFDTLAALSAESGATNQPYGVQ